MRIPHVLPVLVLLAAWPAGALAANVYRCPDGSYADKPCGEGQKVVTTTRRSSTGSDAEKTCSTVGVEAERLARNKASGVSASQALKGVDNEYIAFEEKAVRKKFVVQVYRTQGAPAEVRSLMEAECVAERKAAAEKVAADRAAAERTAAAEKASKAPAAGTATAAAAPPPTGMSKEQCAKLRKDLEGIKRRQKEASEEFGGDAPGGDSRDLEKQTAALCGG